MSRDTWPGDSNLVIASTLTDAIYQKLLITPLVQVYPLASSEQTEPEVLLGIGLARRLTRNLSLTPGLSVRGSDDTPDLALEQVVANRSLQNPTLQITGRTDFVGGMPRTELYLLVPGRSRPVVMVVEERSLEAQLARLATEICRAVGVEVSPATISRWQALAPPSADALRALGQLATRFEPLSRERTTAAISLAHEQPAVTCALHTIDPTDERALAALEQGATHDPLDPQLSLLAFQATWNGSRGDARALKHLDRALALAPALGKAHLWKSIAAPLGRTTLWHAELAYRMLPGNVQVVDHFESLVAEHPSLTAHLPAEHLLTLRKSLLSEAMTIDPTDEIRRERLRALTSS